MNESTSARYEAIVDEAGVVADIEALLPIGVRPRQLSVRTLLVGILLTLSDARPAHLTRVHGALLALGEAERLSLGVVAEWKSGLHELTYRQVEYTLDRIETALAKESPDGRPTELLQGLVDRLIEASILAEHKEGSRSLAIDWTDVESFARPPIPAKAIPSKEGAPMRRARSKTPRE